MIRLTPQQRKKLWERVTKLPEVEIPLNVPRNKIVYGAPGTGKSFILDNDRKVFFPKESQYMRVTFHSNYSYSQFVGSYKPTPLYKDGEEAKNYFTSDMKPLDPKIEPVIDYKFTPGPFIVLLERALKNKKSNFLLLIEEINRANAAAVFGDVFQLLDRRQDGAGEYCITLSPDAMNYLSSLGIKQDQIRLPKNFFIWATMNSADQGVMPIDTAFKRRWSFEYVSLTKGQDVMDKYLIHPKFTNSAIKWNDFRGIINEKLASNVPEDKLLGPFFLKPHELIEQGAQNQDTDDAFRNKLLLYLRDDVLRHNPGILFASGLKTFSQIMDAYDKGENVFNFVFPETIDQKKADVT